MRLDAALASFAAGLGTLLRYALTFVSTLGLSLAGSALVILGLALAWPPLAWIAGGVALLAIDWRRSK